MGNYLSFNFCLSCLHQPNKIFLKKLTLFLLKLKPCLSYCPIQNLEIKLFLKSCGKSKPRILFKQLIIQKCCNFEKKQIK